MNANNNDNDVELHALAAEARALRTSVLRCGRCDAPDKLPGWFCAFCGFTLRSAASPVPIPRFPLDASAWTEGDWGRHHRDRRCTIALWLTGPHTDPHCLPSLWDIEAE